jgi:molecular chaperone HscB
LTEFKDESQTTAPVKCAKCKAVIKGTAVCDFCKSLNPAAASLDFFSLLGLPEVFDIDTAELRKRYLNLSRHAHPDFHVHEAQEVQSLHLQVSSSLNEAYRTLLDPASRAAYLLERLGGKSSADDKSVPDGFLGTMMMMQEELQEALEAESTDEIDQLREVLQTQHDGLVRRITELFQQHQDAVICQAVTSDILNEIRKQVNAVSYVKKLIDLTR